MIYTLAITEKLKLVKEIPIEELKSKYIIWFWIDFQDPTEEEVRILSDYFNFHSLAIEDCTQALQRPKVDYYDEYNFFVIHALNKETLDPEEIDLFIGGNYIISYHSKPSPEIEDVLGKLKADKNVWRQGHIYIAYLIMDNIVDEYFPAIYRIEDYIHELDNNLEGKKIQTLIDDIFDVRGSLLKLRRTINQMRELLYRILNSSHLQDFRENKLYFEDIYDHLLRLAEIVESSREMTSDMRDSYLSVNSNRMNTIMMILTVVTTVFIPLTFISGIYGMNFRYMPELEWRYGYFVVLGFMSVLAFIMILWFKYKGWFDVYK